MMPGRLAEIADRIDQHQRRGPAVRVVLPPEPAFFMRPEFQAMLLDLRLDLIVAINSELFLGHGIAPFPSRPISISVLCPHAPVNAPGREVTRSGEGLCGPDLDP